MAFSSRASLRINDACKAVGDTGEAVGSLAKDAGEGIGSGVKSCLKLDLLTR